MGGRNFEIPGSGLVILMFWPKPPHHSPDPSISEGFRVAHSSVLGGKGFDTCCDMGGHKDSVERSQVPRDLTYLVVHRHEVPESFTGMVQ